MCNTMLGGKRMQHFAEKEPTRGLMGLKGDILGFV